MVCAWVKLLIEVLILDSKGIEKGSEEPFPGRWHLRMPSHKMICVYAIVLLSKVEIEGEQYLRLGESVSFTEWLLAYQFYYDTR
jgi:hypothetical protein